ncbi:MAG: uridine diphosphate-N-acetylglucosamine-binding protein YvcK [Candidatus Bipolaricaulota bacterium]|nr:uridine diphosphate-N-acetylglucosamine-binding protein YvcK [Candidatus Bipolaricaulota bacterium]
MTALVRLGRWLHPGIGVKRWLALVIVSLGLFILGLFVLLGQNLVRAVYTIVAPSALSTLFLAISLMVLGAVGVLFGVQRISRSIVRAIAAPAEGRMGEILFEKRLLSQGPRIVAIGGGTGLSSLLRGLKQLTTNVTAVVTVMDDGGSSGRLRQELNILPPGDIRNCLIALAEDESQISQLFNHRFQGGTLQGHSLGNLVLAGLQEMTGSFDRAIEEMSTLLNTRGQVLPATLEHAELVAELDDGRIIQGESRIPKAGGRVCRMALSNPSVRAYPKVLEEIRHADLIILGPGSLFTSVIPNLLVAGVRHALERSLAKKFYIMNLMTQPGETSGFTARDHVRALSAYLDVRSLDFVVLNKQPVPQELLVQYAQEGSVPVADDLAEPNEWGVRVIRADLLEIVTLPRWPSDAQVPTVKHNSKELARVIAACVPDLFPSWTRW